MKYEFESRICKKCGRNVIASDNENYSWQCINCDEDLFDFETEVIKDYKEIND